MKKITALFRKAANQTNFVTFLKITFTEKELEMIRERWDIFDALGKGLSQREAAAALSCSVVTVTRGAANYRKERKNIEHFLKIYRKA